MYQLKIEDYEITKNGLVINKRNGRILKFCFNAKGYYRVHIGGRKEFVHRLVAKAHIPNPNNLPQVNHKNGVKTDNRVENLEWVDNTTNRAHAVKNKLHAFGERNCSKLKENDVIFIRKHLEIPANELAKKYGISTRTILDVRNKRSWKHI